MRGIRRAALQAFSGGLVWCASPGLGDVAWLAAVALVPFLLSLRGSRGAGAALWGLMGGLWYAIPGRWATFSTALSAMGFAGWLELSYLVVFFLSYALPFAIFALFWQSVERTHAQAWAPWFGGFLFAGLIVFWPSVFPYTPLAMISNQVVWIQLAEVGGEAVLLGLLLTSNLGAALWLSEPRQLQALFACVLPLAICGLYGVAALARWNEPPNQVLSVHAVQSNWPRLATDHLLLRDQHSTRPLSAVELSRAAFAATPSCAIQLWPETARRPQAPDRLCERAAQLAAEYERPILATCHAYEDSGPYLAARLYDGATPLQAHRKLRLVPVFEAAAAPSKDRANSLQNVPFSLANGIKLMLAICYEIYFRHDLRRAVVEGADALAHAANFSIFRSPRISHWDLAMSRLRAVELRRSIVRSVNAGLAGMVDPTGRWTPTAPQGTSGAQCHQVALNSRLSIYARVGDSVFWALLMLFTVLQLRGATKR